MDDTQAVAILKSLAAGLDPAGGEPLAEVATLRTPDVVGALALAAATLEVRGRQERKQGSLPRNAGKPWSQEEDARLLQGFDGGATVEALSAAHERTRTGIEARLVKHGRIDAEQAPAARFR